MEIGLPCLEELTAPQMLAAAVILGVYREGLIVPNSEVGRNGFQIGVEDYEPLSTYGASGKRGYPVEELHPRCKLDPSVYGTFGRVWKDYGPFFCSKFAKHSNVNSELLAAQFDLHFAVEVDAMERRDRTIPFQRAETLEWVLSQHYLGKVRDWDSLQPQIRVLSDWFLPKHLAIAKIPFKRDPEHWRKVLVMLAA